MTAHTPTPMTAESLRILRAKHAVRLMESGDTVNSLLDHIDWLAAKLSREENEHAELQSRCFEGFPSVSDGVFDALKEATRSRAALIAALESAEPALAGLIDCVESDLRGASESQHDALATVRDALKAEKGEAAPPPGERGCVICGRANCRGHAPSGKAAKGEA